MVEKNIVNMENRQLSQEEIKEIQLEILCNIDSFCERNNIRYSLAYGTLLGAIRHKGYIPWDDDIDVMMPRPDYERFLNEFPKINDRFQLQTYINDDSYFLAFAKVYDNRTEQIIFPTRTGVFVDIFPVDGIPEDLPKRDQYINRKLKLIYKDILYTCNNLSYRPGNKLFNVIKYYLKQIITPQRDKTISKLDELWKKYPFESSKFVGVIVDVDAKVHKGQVRRDVFEKYTTAVFEDKEFKIIENYKEFLQSQYGDFLQLPPEEDRVPGHAAPVYWKDC